MIGVGLRYSPLSKANPYARARECDLRAVWRMSLGVWRVAAFVVVVG